MPKCFFDFTSGKLYRNGSLELIELEKEALFESF